MARITKSNLIENVAKDLNMAKSQVEKVYQSIIDSMSKSLHKGDTVALSDFGIFSTKQRKARQGRNPKTGDKIQIAARKVLSFRPGKKIKDFITGAKKGKK